MKSYNRQFSSSDLCCPHCSYLLDPWKLTEDNENFDCEEEGDYFIICYECKKGFDVQVEVAEIKYSTRCSHKEIYKYLTQALIEKLCCGVCGEELTEERAKYYSSSKILDRSIL